MNSQPNVDPAELAKFGELASRWWDPAGPMAPLHGINPLRMAFIEESDALNDQKVLDVGCGGGILTEALASRGAQAHGIDMSPEAIEVAELHLHESGLDIDYRCIEAAALLPEEAQRYDRILCMELLEHVPDPEALIAVCAQLTKPGGELVFSTLNRNPKAFALAIVGAEYLLGLIPRGTHDYARFIKPSELASWCRSAGLEVKAMRGLGYNPLTRTYALNDDVGVNYLVRCDKSE